VVQLGKQEFKLVLANARRAFHAVRGNGNKAAVVRTGRESYVHYSSICVAHMVPFAKIKSNMRVRRETVHVSVSL
jgi:hypothetical protein